MANTWFAFKGYNNNQPVNVSIFDMTELDALGFHGYPTEADAAAKPNSVPGFPNPLAAVAIPVVNAAIADANNARDFASAPGNAAKAAGNAAKNAVGSLLGSGWHLVFGGTSGLLGRILKVLFGGVLMIAGIMRMTGASRLAGTAVKGAVPV